MTTHVLQVGCRTPSNEISRASAIRSSKRTPMFAPASRNRSRICSVRLRIPSRLHAPSGGLAGLVVRCLSLLLRAPAPWSVVLGTPLSPRHSKPEPRLRSSWLGVCMGRRSIRLDRQNRLRVYGADRTPNLHSTCEPHVAASTPPTTLINSHVMEAHGLFLHRWFRWPD